MPDWQVYDWREEALCTYAGDPDAWFSGAYALPRRVCALCPVRQDCLMYAIRNGIAYGLWGGMTESERRAYARQEGIPYEANWLSPDDPAELSGEPGEPKRPDVDTGMLRELRSQGLTYKSIGEIVRMSAQAVHDRLARADVRAA